MHPKYVMGRALALAQDDKLERYDTPEAEVAYEREQRFTGEIEKAGGWDDQVERGYSDMRRELAQER